jgi:hypothetical protein
MMRSRAAMNLSYAFFFYLWAVLLLAGRAAITPAAAGGSIALLDALIKPAYEQEGGRGHDHDDDGGLHGCSSFQYPISFPI